MPRVCPCMHACIQCMRHRLLFRWSHDLMNVNHVLCVPCASVLPFTHPHEALLMPLLCLTTVQTGSMSHQVSLHAVFGLACDWYTTVQPMYPIHVCLITLLAKYVNFCHCLRGCVTMACALSGPLGFPNSAAVLFPLLWTQVAAVAVVLMRQPWRGLLHLIRELSHSAP